MACIFCEIAAKRAPASFVHEDDEIMAARGKAYIAEVGRLDPVDVRGTLYQSHKECIAVKVCESRAGLCAGHLRFRLDIDRGEDAARDR